MNVLHMTLSFSPGGRREAIARLAESLARLGASERLCCLEEFDSSEAERSAYFVDSIALRRRRVLDLGALRQLREYCRANAIDVVHTHDAASQAAAVCAMPLGGPPILMTFHRTLNFESARLRDRLRNAIVGLRVGAVVTASEYRRRHFVESNYVRAEKVRRIPLGIDPSRFRPDAARRAAKRAELGVDDSELLFGTVGHFRREKGVDLAIDAFQNFCDRNPERRCRLVVLGTGNAEQQALMRSRISPRHADRIRLVGFQQRQEEWFPAFDLLLHGARDEAFGLVLIEAMACGVPVVAAGVGGIPEVVGDGAAGVLARAPDAGALAEAIAVLANVPDRLASARVAAIARVQREFDSATYAGRYLELYRSLLADRPGERAAERPGPLSL